VPDVEGFMDEVVADFRRRLALLADNGDRRAIEDGIALLTDYRLNGMDERQLEKLLSMLAGGRSPVGLMVLKPEILGAELARRWQSYAAPERSVSPSPSVSERTREAIAVAMATG
jgi:hypothetical protein